MNLKNSFKYFLCYWKYSFGLFAKFKVISYYLKRILFYLGVYGINEHRLVSLKLDDLKIFFNISSPEAGTFKEIFVDKVYEREDYFIPQNGWTVLDLGANIGAFSLRNSSRVRNGRIIAFEPNYDIFSILSKNLKANQIQNVAIFPLAIGAQQGIMKFIVSCLSTGDGSIVEWRYKNLLKKGNYKEFPVMVDTLDHFAELYEIKGPIDLIKFDIEGAEYDAICGGKNVLKMTKRIVMEFHDETIFAKIKLKLAENGFDCIRILHENKIAYFLKKS